MAAPPLDGGRRPVSSVVPRSRMSPVPAEAAVPSACERGGAAAGVGSKTTQPMPSNQASTHEWASRSRTM